MAIKEVKMFTVVCDNCGRDAFEDGEFSAWSDSSFAIDCAEDEGWVHDEEVFDTHYCPDCWYWDDDGNLKVKEVEK
jgi:hypothetical protein